MWPNATSPRIAVLVWRLRSLSEWARRTGSPPSYFHFNENDIPDYGIPWYFNRAAPVPRHNYYGFRDGNYLRTDVDMVTLKLEHDISDWAILRNRIRFANNQRDARITEPQLNNATSGSITPATPLSQISVNRNQIATFSNEGLLWDQLDATAHVKTFGIRHVVGHRSRRRTRNL